MIVLVGLLTLVLAELYVLARVVSAYGVMITLLALILFGAGGAWLVKHEGVETWRRISDGLRAGRVPTTGLVDGFLVMMAGAFLLVPGFLTDIAGLVLLVPPLRKLVGVVLMRSIQKRVSRRVRVVGTRLGSAGPLFDEASRSYFRPGEPNAPTTRSDARSGGSGHDEVIDLDGEEYFLGEAIGELDPPDRDR